MKRFRYDYNTDTNRPLASIKLERMNPEFCVNVEVDQVHCSILYLKKFARVSRIAEDCQTYVNGCHDSD